MEADDVGGRRSSVVEGARRAIEQRELVPGHPEEGPYPSSVPEVVDELAAFVVELDETCARGVLFELAVRLAELSAKPERRPLR